MSVPTALLPPTVVKEIETILLAYSDIITVQYTSVSSLVILLWEYAITFDDEYKYFWTSSLSLTSVLYFFNRYANIIFRLVNTCGYFLTSLISCFNWVKYVQVGSSSISLFAAQFVLILRIWAIYGKSTKVLAFTVVLWLLTAAASSAVLGKQSEHAFGTAEPLPGLFFCVLISPVNFLYAYWIPNVVFEGYAFIMVGYKSFVHARATSASKAITRMSIMNIIFRDSSAYVVVMFCAALANAMLYRFGRPGLYDMAQGPTISLFAVLVTRMLTNLRKAGERPAGHSTDIQVSGQMTSLKFNSGRGARHSYVGRARSGDMVTTETAIDDVELMDIGGDVV